MPWILVVPNADTPLLSVENLEIAFGSFQAVKGISFSIKPGDVLALVGESGSGKSVTAMSCLQLVSGASYPCGSINWQGSNVLAMNNDELVHLRGNDIAVIFQEPMSALNPVHTVGDQVAEALELHTDLTAGQRRQRVIELFTEVGIPDPGQRVDQYPHELSGGMRQRVCIAMALACDPELLIADEPTTALDVTIQAQILDLIKRLQRERGMAVLFITHDLGVVADLADHVALMYKGELVEHGPVHDIFANPQHPYTRGLLACRPRLGARQRRLPTLEDFLE